MGVKVTTTEVDRHGARRRPRWAGVLLVYLLIGVLYTWPLLPLASTRIAHSPYDPLLNTSILWWNATNIPLTEAWWNPPYYHLNHGVTTFSENLLGISVFASPIYWLTRNPLTAYNVSLYLAWPLSAFAVYLLTACLTRRRDAAFLAGLAFGFTPYRAAELGHIQMVSSYWFPLALLGLHRFLDDRRIRWLILFAIAFVLQTLANGYLLFYGGVLVGLWLAYFCTTREHWRVLGAVLLAWAMAAVALAPVLIKYVQVHDEYNFHRAPWFSLPVDAFLQVSHVIWLWRHALPDGAHNLFPGVVALAMVAAVLVIALRQPPPETARTPLSRPLRVAAAMLGAVSLAAVVYTAAVGPWRVTIAGKVLTMTNLLRASTVVAVCAVVLLWPLARLRAAVARRSVWVFYAGATVAMAILSWGPELRFGEHVMLGPAPYAWLSSLPGFNELRVPTRFWILGVMCLGVAAGLSFDRFVPRASRYRRVACAVIAVALLVDGWLYSIPMEAAPVMSPTVETAGGTRPILELPLGPQWDTAATYRSIAHRRPVFNGASGYEPQHYQALKEGLANLDPAMLRALARLGTFDVIVNGADDPDGAIARYVEAAPGISVLGRSDGRSAYRVPAADLEPELGPTLSIARVTAFDDSDASRAADGNAKTDWTANPQEPGEWLTADLGAVQVVGGVSQGLGAAAGNFPRRLAVDLSIDGVTWDEVWEGPGAAAAFRSAVDAPLDATMRFRLPPRPARYVRLRLTTSDKNPWRVTELQVHAAK